MRRFAAAAVLVVLLVGVAPAQPFDPCCQDAAGPYAYRFPRLAVLGRAARATPPTFPRHPVGSAALSAGVDAVDLIGSTALQTALVGVSQAIRLTRVALVGSPFAGQPLRTTVWVASPTFITAGNYVREVRALRAAGVIGPGW